ncbi:sulfotransferase ssu-1-like [Ixodes scapularis]|uniref:sulfotransferase ssu-1-like n=1 Tax=Ixodes scapularis TaxID=6945 RepID=UPI001A9D02C7|nr:sulfotransferase ssu-1-like [Ixodes scapularis]
MQATKKSIPVYREIEGLYLSYYFSDENVRSALAYKPRPDDVFIVGYPKCGTTWMQYLLCNIFSGGVPPRDTEEFEAKSPFLLFTGAQGAEEMPRPGAIKTHFSFNKQPYSKEAKYFYVTRNPYDCWVSFYHHMRNTPAYFFEDGTFDQFFDLFMEGKCEFGDYFDHLLSWYEHRNDLNVFFLTYEDLKKDTASWVLKMADFLGKEYGERLRSDLALLKRIVEVSSVPNMKEALNDAWKSPAIDVPAVVETEGSLQITKESLEAAAKKPMTGDFVRKGVVGDWRNHFSPEQIERMKQRVATKTACSDVMQLWKEYDLP